MLAILTCLSACNSLFTFPVERSQQERFAMIPVTDAPVKAPLRIYWDEHAIPFIEAEHDEDLAFGIGLVHAHLRWGQLEMLRHLSQGRISELAGPIPQLASIDQGIRTINLCAAGEASLKVMRAESRQWLNAYQNGLNWYISHQTTRPVELQFFDLQAQPFSQRDLLCIARLASADLSWGTYFKYLKMAEQYPDWQTAFKHSLTKLSSDSASYRSVSSGELGDLLQQVSKSGSNSAVVAGSRSETGSALIANDPHVGLMLPNFWLLIGLKSPSYHAVGLMIPGVPVLGVGRNTDIAWGGTNMRAISSHLYDVTDLAAEQIQSRTERIKRRNWFGKEVQIRETEFGPILTDIPYFDPDKSTRTLAISWLGRNGSDEIGAFLDVARARSWLEFRNAFDSYQVSAMNMLYADRHGNIGFVPAYGLPVLKNPEQTLDLVKTRDNPVVNIRKPGQQPNPFNPPSGYIASANNKPFASTDIPYAYGYANNDRFERLEALLKEDPRISVDSLKALQLDTYSRNAHQLTMLLTDHLQLDDFGEQQKLFSLLHEWDGHFSQDSRGAVVAETVLYYAWQSYIKERAHSPAMQAYLQDYGNWKPELLAWIGLKTEKELLELMQQWLQKASPHVQKYPSWGDFHRQRQIPMLGLIPVIGSRFSLPDYSQNGSNDTLNKAGRPFSPEQQFVTYGASARHISDLSAPNENYFVLHGGQDGWLMNPNLADQTRLWRDGQYIRIPLEISAVERQFKRHVTVLRPANP